MLQCFVINLPKETHRLESVQAQFKDYEAIVKLNVIEAVNGSNDPKVDEMQQKYAQESIKENTVIMTQGEIGCFLSHQKALKAFLKTDEEYALIIEDDILLKEGFWDNLSEISEFYAKQQDTFLLFSLLSVRKRYFYCESLKGDNALIQPINAHTGSVAYFINRSVAKIIINKLPIRRYDWMIKRLFTDNNICFIMPMIALIGCIGVSSSIDTLGNNGSKKRSDSKKSTQQEIGMFRFRVNKLMVYGKYQALVILAQIKMHGFIKTMKVLMNLEH